MELLFIIPLVLLVEGWLFVASASCAGRRTAEAVTLPAPRPSAEPPYDWNSWHLRHAACCRKFLTTGIDLNPEHITDEQAKMILASLPAKQPLPASAWNP